jgi:predicted nucleic acid-binding protein
MTLVVDANIAVAVLDVADPFHRSALRRCLEAEQVEILNLTRAEALIYPTRVGKFDEADVALDRLGFQTVVLEDSVADCARELRANYGNKNFPMVDAVVVALGIERGWPVLTCDAKWPAIQDATIEVLKAD